MARVMQRPRHLAVTKRSPKKENAVALVPAVTAPVDEPRTHGVLLASVLLALPGVIAARGSAGSLILAFSAITAALLIERRPRAALRISEVTRPAMPTAIQLRSGPRARWELVERDGHASLEMHWR
jgi:hypothetical protein